MSFEEAKKKKLVTPECADLLLEAQAATGHIIDPQTNRKLTVDEACSKDIVDTKDRGRLLEAEKAAVGFKDPYSAQPLSVFEAMKKRLVKNETGLRLLQAQESVGGILDPKLSVFLPKDTAIKRNILDEITKRSLDQSPRCFIDPDTGDSANYNDLKKRCKTDPETGLLLLPVSDQQVIFEGVRKPVTTKQLLECQILDKETLRDLENGKKSVPKVSEDKKVNLKGTGSVGGIITPQNETLSLTEAKKQMYLSPECTVLLLEAQAATGHIIDPKNNKKLSVNEACANRVVDMGDKDRLLEAEKAAVGYKVPTSAKPLSVHEASKKGLVNSETALRLLQAQESVGGILDPDFSVFLPKDEAIKRNILDRNTSSTLDQNPKCYVDPDTEDPTSYNEIKKRCKTDSKTGLLLLPATKKKDSSQIVFDGIRKPVSAKQLSECEVIDKPTLKDLQTEKKSVKEVSADQKGSLKGTGPIAGIVVGQNKILSFTEAKKKKLVAPECADLLLEAQAATGYIIDPQTNRKLTVDEACSKDIVDTKDRGRLLEAEKAAVGYKDPYSAQPLSVFEAMKKRLVDNETGLRLLQAQESVGGILDPTLSVFLHKDKAIKRNILDENIKRSLDQTPKCYIDPKTDTFISYNDLKKTCKTDPQTGLLLIPVPEKLNASQLIFNGVRKPVNAQQLCDCDMIDKITLENIYTAKKSIQEVSLEKKINLCGSEPIAGIVTEKNEKMSFTEAKKKMLLSPKCADFLLDAQAATGHIIDPKNNKRLTVDEACANKLVDISDKERLLAAEKAAVGYRDQFSPKCLSTFEAMKKKVIDNETGLRLLQAQQSLGGILDPELSVYLPKDIAIKRSLIDENTFSSLNTISKSYIDPDTNEMISYNDLKKRCETEPHTGLLLLPVTEKVEASKLLFDGVRKPITAKQLCECGILDKSTLNYIVTKKKSLAEVSGDIKHYLKGKNPIAGIILENKGKMSFTDAKKQMLLTPECANLLLEAQAATGYVIEPNADKKFTVDEACAKNILDTKDRERFLTAEAAVSGFKDPTSSNLLSVFEAMKKGMTDNKTSLRILQAQLSAGGIFDPTLSVFLPVDSAIKHNLLDEITHSVLKQYPALYLDPENGNNVSYDELKKKCKTDPLTGQLLLPVSAKANASKLIFEGVCKSITAQELRDCGLLDNSTLELLRRGEKTVLQVSEEKKLFLKGSGPIAGVTTGSFQKLLPSEAKKQGLISSESADLLLLAQAATGHIIDPKTNQRLSVDEAHRKGMFDLKTRDGLLLAESAVVGFKHPTSSEPLSVFEALNKGIVDKTTALRLLQAQEASGGIFDPKIGVFLPKDTAIKRHILDENISRDLAQNPRLYVDPDTEENVSYHALKKKSKVDSPTGLILFPLQEQKDPSKIMFQGIHKQLSAQDLFDCNVIDKTTFFKLIKGERTVAQVSEELKVYLNGTGLIAGVQTLQQNKISVFEAKKLSLLPSESADLLLEVQAATGHILDPRNNRKLTVDQAYRQRLLDIESKDKLLEAEKAAFGFKDNNSDNTLSLYQAMKKGIIKRDTALRLLRAQASAGGILDPYLGIFLPKDAAIRRNILDEKTWDALKESPTCCVDPETGKNISYEGLREKCITDKDTGLKLIPLSKNIDPNNITFDGVYKTITVRQLLECRIINEVIFEQLIKGVISIYDVMADKMIFLKGTGSIAGVAAGPTKKMSFSEAKKNQTLPPESTNLLLEAQAATGLIIDPKTNERMTVKEACAKGVVDKEDESSLFAAEKAAVGYKDPTTNMIMSAGQAFKRGLIDKDTTLRVLQAQEAAGGILDPVLGIFLPRNIALARNLIDQDICNQLNKVPQVYLDPDTQQPTDYNSIKSKCKTDPSTGLLLLPEPQKSVTFQGFRRQVSLVELVNSNLLEESDVNLFKEGKITRKDIEDRLRPYLRGSSCIAGVYHEASDRIMTLYQAMKSGLLRPGTTLELLEAQAASGFIIDPVNNDYLSVDEAHSRRVFGSEFKNKLLSAERAVTGYKMRGTEGILSLFQAMDKGLIEKGHGIRLLEAQIASGGIIDPEHSHRIDVSVAYKKGYFDEEMNQILTDDSDDTKGFFDPNTQENLTYLDLQKRCIKDQKTGLFLLPIFDKKKQETTQKKRKRRVVIVDPETNKEMTVREAYDKGYIDDETFYELIQQECDWEEITVTASDGSSHLVIIDKQSGRQFDVTELLERGVINQIILHKYQSQMISLPDFADIIMDKTKQSGYSAMQSPALLGSSLTSSTFTSKTSAVPSLSSLTSSTSSHSAASIGDTTKLGFVDSTKQSSISSVNTSTFTSKMNTVPGVTTQTLSSSATFPSAAQRTESINEKTSSQTSAFSPVPALSLSTSQFRDTTGDKTEQDVIDSSTPSRFSNTSVVKTSTFTSKTSADSSAYPQATTSFTTTVSAAPPDSSIQSREESFYSTKQSTISTVTTVKSTKIISKTSTETATSPRTSLSLSTVQISPTAVPSSDVLDSSSESVVSVQSSTFTSKTSSEPLVQSSTILKSQSSAPLLTDTTSDKDRLIQSSRPSSSTSSIKTSTFISKTSAEPSTSSLMPLSSSAAVSSDAQPDSISDQTRQSSFSSTKHSTVSNASSVKSTTITSKSGTESAKLDKPTSAIRDSTTDSGRQPETSVKSSTFTFKTSTVPSPASMVTSSLLTSPSAAASSSTTTTTKHEETDPTNKSGGSKVSIVRTSTTYTSRMIEEPDESSLTTVISPSTSQTLSSFSFGSTSPSVASRSIISDTSESVGSGSRTVSKVSYVTSSTSKASAESDTSPSTMTSILSLDSPTSPGLSFSSSLSPLSSTSTRMTTTRTSTITEQGTSMSDDSAGPGKQTSSVSITLTTPIEIVVGEQSPIGGIFDSDSLEKITVTEAVNRGLVDSITAQRLLEAQACTGGIIDPENGRRIGIQEAMRNGIITNDMCNRLKAAQKAYVGYEDVKTKKKMSAAEAIKERWLPYEAGSRFMEYQFVTGGLYDPEMGCRRSIQDALSLGWVDVRTAQKLQDSRYHTKNLTCPKSKLKISYKEALDNCLVEEGTGVKMLQASLVSSKGISSPYNASSAPGSHSGSRSGSRLGSRRSSVDLGSSSIASRFSHTSFTAYSSTK